MIVVQMMRAEAAGRRFGAMTGSTEIIRLANIGDWRSGGCGRQRVPVQGAESVGNVGMIWNDFAPVKPAKQSSEQRGAGKDCDAALLIATLC